MSIPVYWKRSRLRQYLHGAGERCLRAARPPEAAIEHGQFMPRMPRSAPGIEKMGRDRGVRRQRKQRLHTLTTEGV